MKGHPDKIIRLRLDGMVCRSCKSREVLQKVSLKYNRCIYDYEIVNTWYFCPVCGDKYYQHIRAKTAKSWQQAEFN